MDDQIDIVEQNPLKVILSLDVPRSLPVFFLRSHPDSIDDRSDLEIGISRRKYEYVGDSADVVYVQNKNVPPFLLEYGVDRQTRQLTSRSLRKPGFVFRPPWNDIGA